MILESELGRRPADIIREYITEEKELIHDFMFIGNKGADFSSNNEEAYLGSVANEIIRNTNINVMFVGNVNTHDKRVMPHIKNVESLVEKQINIA